MPRLQLEGMKKPPHGGYGCFHNYCAHANSCARLQRLLPFLDHAHGCLFKPSANQSHFPRRLELWVSSPFLQYAPSAPCYICLIDLRLVATHDRVIKQSLVMALFLLISDLVFVLHALARFLDTLEPPVPKKRRRKPKPKSE